ncbi:hypothetical protein EYR38_001468 [Pleurotus pulmonarius]|nr:hypothetical protein EYR38_001468 [Pleurotus pulmonarius]
MDVTPSYNANITSYMITLKQVDEATGKSPRYLLYVEETDTPPRSNSDYRANGVSAIYNLLSKIKNNSSIPMPQGNIPFSGKVHLGQLHAIQNDWFGLPSVTEPAEPSYSWQESFVFLFETLLEEIKPLPISKRLDLRFEDIQRYLSRAIGFFLFDDVEVPALIGFAISEDDVLVHVPDEASPTATIKTILPNFSWAVWGDPLLESLFMPPGPSPAVMEGYTGAGGSPPIVFPRQKTKRLWYSLYLSLLILCKGESQPKETSEDGPKTTWALRTAQECGKALKDAPCY